MRAKNPTILILGTSHISPQSIRKIQKTFKKEKPDVLALELDRARFFGLIEKKVLTLKDAVKNLGIKAGVVAWILSRVQRMLGNKTGIMPGEEMMIAANEARKHNTPIAFVDQDARITMKKLAQIPLKEKISLLFGFGGMKIKIDLKRVPSARLIEKMIEQLRKKTPNLYRVLIEERNDFIAHSIMHISSERRPKKILVVVGAGHRKGLGDVLKSKGFKKIKLL